MLSAPAFVRAQSVAPGIVTGARPEIVTRMMKPTIIAAIAHLWASRDDRYSELRTINTEGLSRKDRKVEMSYIGG